MANALTQSPPIQTVADLLARLGDIPAHRVRFQPIPGTATERDVIDVEARENRLCELVEGTLVEKTMGYEESALALWLATILMNYVRPRKLGIVTGADGTIRLMPGLVRIPDIAFVSRNRLPGRKLPKEPIPDLIPDLVVEVLSKSNSKKEMRRKLREYFGVGVRLVWYIDPKTQTVQVFTSANQSTTLKTGQPLDGGDVLAGFQISLSELFSDPTD